MVDLLSLYTVLGTWALVIGTIVLMYWQTRQTTRLASATSVLQLRERFDTSQSRRARRELAAQLLKGGEEDLSSEEVPNFFELTGALVRGRMLDEKLVWDAFGTWITSYYWSLRHPVDRIAAIRSSLRDPLVFTNFEWLQGRMRRLDGKRARHAEHAGDHLAEDARELLQREATLALT